MIEWEEKYLLHIEILDNQHKELFDIINDAKQLLMVPIMQDKYEEIILLLTRLQQYAQNHFTTEENLMKEIKYPNFLDHKEEHDLLVAQISGVDLSTVEILQQSYLQGMIDFLLEWIIGHMQKSDRSIADYYHKKNNK